MKENKHYSKLVWIPIITIMLLFIAIINVSAYDIATSTPTIINEIDNTAYVESSEGIVNIDKFELESGEEAIISFEKNSDDELYDICIKGFVGFESIIKLKNVKKDVSWWFDENLLTTIEKEGDLYCFNSFVADDITNIRFQAEYTGADKLKYDVYILPAKYNKNFNVATEGGQLLILDPYLIGTELEEDPKLESFWKFDGNTTDENENITLTYNKNNPVTSLFHFSNNLNDSRGYTSKGGVALYNLGNNPSGTLEDKWGSSDGTRNNGQTGVVCDGVDDYINLPLEVDAENDFSFSITLNSQTASTYHNTIFSQKVDNAGLNFWADSSTIYKARLNNLTGGAVTIESSYVVGETNTISVSFDKSNGNFSIYKDGIIQDSDIVSSPVNGADKSLIICKYPIYNVRYYKGSIYNLTFWDKTLSNTEVVEIYQLNKPETRTAYVNTNGLVYGGLFALNQNSEDISGNGNDGTDTNVDYIGTGMVGNGINSYINLSDTVLDYIDDFTICLNDVKFNTLGNQEMLVATDNTNRLYLYKDTNERIIFHKGLDIVAQTDISFININEKYNICGFFDYSESNISLYINGNYITSNVNTDVASAYSGLNIGSYDEGTSAFFNGTIGKTFIYNKTLSEEEILTLNNSGSFVLDKEGENNKAINLTDSYILTELTSNPINQSFWFYNGTWNFETNDSIFTTVEGKVAIGENYDIIDEVRTYNRTLIASELSNIQTNYDFDYNYTTKAAMIALNGNYSTNLQDETNTTIKLNGYDEWLSFENNQMYFQYNTTISFFMKDNTSYRNTIFSQTSQPTNNMIWYNESAIIVDIAGTEYVYNTQYSITDNEWHNIILNRNDTNLDVLLNNASLGTQAISGNFYINYVPYKYDGYLDELLYFTKTIDETEEEILQGGYEAAFNLVFKDEETEEIINNVSLEVFSDTQSSDYTITDGTFFLSGFPEEVTTIRYRSDGYAERFYYIDFASGNQFFDVTLYLLNETNANEITETIYDNSGFNELEGAYIKHLKFFPDDNTYRVVGMGKSNYEGITKAQLQKGTEFYKFYLYYPDLTTVKTTTSPSYVFSDNINFKISIQEVIGERFDNIMGVNTDLTYNNVTENFKLDFDNTAGSSVTTTLDVYKMTAGEKILVDSGTTTTPTGSILVNVPVINDTTYIATAKVVFNTDTTPYLLDEITYINYNENKFGTMGIFILIILTLIMAMVGFYSLSIMIILTPLPLIFCSMLQIVQFDTRLAIVIQILAIGISLMVKY